MARQFDGVNDFMASAVSLALLAGKQRLAIGMWVLSDWASDDDILWEMSENTNVSTGSFRFVANSSELSKPVVVSKGSDGEPTTMKVDAGGPTSGEWTHVLLNLNLGNSGIGGVYEVESLWFNGVQSTMTNEGAPDSVGTYSDHVFYVMSRAGTALFMDGRAADLCIWLPVSPIVGADATALAAGTRAIEVRTSEIAYYWPIEGIESPEPGLIGGVPLTVSGATFIEDPPSLDAVPETQPVEFEVNRTGMTTVSIDWGTTPGDAPYGLTIYRIVGSYTQDGSGDDFGDVDYDPSTISGAAVIATGETTSPYLDSGLDGAEVYTYFIVRTGEDA